MSCPLQWSELQCCNAGLGGLEGHVGSSDALGQQDAPQEPEWLGSLPEVSKLPYVHTVPMHRNTTHAGHPEAVYVT